MVTKVSMNIGVEDWVGAVRRPQWMDEIAPNSKERNKWIRGLAERAARDFDGDLGMASSAVAQAAGCCIGAAKRHVAVVLGLAPERSGGRGGARVPYGDIRRQLDIPASGTYVIEEDSGHAAVIRFNDGPAYRIFNAAIVPA